MFERFTRRARAVVVQARDEADRLHQPRVGTEHLLLALLHDGQSLAATVLRDAGVRIDDLRSRVEQATGPGSRALDDADAAALREIGIDLAAVVARVEESFGPGALDDPPPAPRRWPWGRRYDGSRFSPRAKKVLELALREAVRLRHNHIGTEHILLGLLREGNGLAAVTLTRAGLDLVDLRRRVLDAVRTAARPAA
ncbi:Clp protease [Micromonospora echinofusca]|uniref:Clp protease n=1 Tax=Micromonospora echinofusca TaxID=47858 RepID=A0ABS3VVQ1_MICEH|nr:Clp protease N-terminal domain-containing protein [Micromonospora echinofusca]MBO4208626.1 Clp protease [Micromonospora echinofusca]